MYLLRSRHGAFCWAMIAVLFLAALGLGGCARGGQVIGGQKAGIVVEQAWSRPVPMAEGTGALFIMIKNNGDQADALLEVKTDIAKMTEMHETVMKGDVMEMRPIAGQRIEIPAQGSVELKPGGLHVMLMEVAKPLAAGDKFEAILRFEKTGEQIVTVEVRPMEGMQMEQSY